MTIYTYICITEFMICILLNLLGNSHILPLGATLVQTLFLLSCISGDLAVKKIATKSRQKKNQTLVLHPSISLWMYIFAVIGITGAAMIYFELGANLYKLLLPEELLSHRSDVLTTNTLSGSLSTFAFSFSAPMAALCGYLFSFTRNLRYLFLASVPFLIHLVAFSSKGSIILFVALFLGGYLSHSRFNFKSILKLRKLLRQHFGPAIIILGIVGTPLAILFWAISSINGQEKSAIEQFLIYLSGPQLALNELINYHPPSSLDFSFCNHEIISKVLNIFGASLAKNCSSWAPLLSSEVVYIPFPFNAYSAPAYSLYAFGYVGMCLYAFAIGIIFRLSTLCRIKHLHADPFASAFSFLYSCTFFFTDAFFFYTGASLCLLMSLFLNYIPIHSPTKQPVKPYEAT